VLRAASRLASFVPGRRSLGTGFGTYPRLGMARMSAWAQCPVDDQCGLSDRSLLTS
jgi:hypothetical protein